MKWRMILALSASFLAGRAATASDGVVEINQASALAGAVTPGDAPGFPVTIDLPGSYRLTSNLDSPIDTGAIVITAVNVTLDLGGFQVASTNSCTGYPTSSCTTQFGVSGIYATGYLVTVRNGVVTAMGGHCVGLYGASSVVEDVRALGCGASGIYVADAGRASRCFAGGNRFEGISVGQGGVVEGSEARANGRVGIDNALGLGGLITGNRSFQNADDGFEIDGETLISRNIASGNGSLQIRIWAPAKSLGDNLCNGSFC